MQTSKQFKVNVMALLVTIEGKINNTDYLTNKLQNVHALHCTIVLYIVQSWPELSYLKDSKGRGPDRKVKWWLINILLKCG